MLRNNFTLYDSNFQEAPTPYRHITYPTEKLSPHSQVPLTLGLLNLKLSAAGFAPRRLRFVLGTAFGCTKRCGRVYKTRPAVALAFPN